MTFSNQAIALCEATTVTATDETAVVKSVTTSAPATTESNVQILNRNKALLSKLT